MNGSEVNNFHYSVFYTDKTLMYGILCSDENENIIDRIDDITQEADVVDDFCRMLNSAEVHPCHFYDVYEDFFG